MGNILLDTNILIYFSNRDEKYLNLLKNLTDNELSISIISYIEFTVYPQSDKEVIEFLNIVNLDKKISDIATGILRSTDKKTTRNPKFSDIIIGATAQSLNVPLITNNPKDFAIFKNLEIISV